MTHGQLRYGWRTERDLFAGVRRESEGEKGHAGDEGAGDDEVEHVVERAAADVDRERDVDVLFRAALVLLHIPYGRQPCTDMAYDTRKY